MELNGWDRQTINQALTISAQVHVTQNHNTHQVDRLHQIASSTIISALGRYVRKKMSIFLPTAKHLRFHVPPPALTYQGHRYQLAITTFRFWSWPFELWRNLFPNIIHNDKHPGAKILKIGYHFLVLLCGGLCLETISYHIGGFFVNRFYLA
jgi:hypothetical protein